MTGKHSGVRFGAGRRKSSADPKESSEPEESSEESSGELKESSGPEPNPIPAVTPGPKRDAPILTLGQFYEFVDLCTSRDPSNLGKMAATNPEIQMRLEALENWVHRAARTCRDTLHEHPAGS